MADMTMELDSNIESITKVLDALKDLSARKNIDYVSVKKVSLALDEIVSNIINYAFDENKGEFSVSFSVDESSLRVVIRDKGKPFNPLKAETPDTSSSLENRKIGGLGIHFVKKMMDKVEYYRDGNENVIILVKKIDKAD